MSVLPPKPHHIEGIPFGAHTFATTTRAFFHYTNTATKRRTSVCLLPPPLSLWWRREAGRFPVWRRRRRLRGEEPKTRARQSGEGSGTERNKNNSVAVAAVAAAGKAPRHHLKHLRPKNGRHFGKLEKLGVVDTQGQQTASAAKGKAQEKSPPRARRPQELDHIPGTLPDVKPLKKAICTSHT